MEQLQPHFQLKMVNGLQGDPAIYGFAAKSGDALLFDLGSVDALAHKDLMRVRLALVSHAHVDHFIGFDRLLRVNIPHRRCLELCGPHGFIDNVLGKLAGYTWNLLDAGQLNFVVHEVQSNGAVRRVRITNGTGNQFNLEDVKVSAPVGSSLLPKTKSPGVFVAELSNGAGVYAVALDHGTDSIAYACHVPGASHVSTDALTKIGLQPGPWIKELQFKAAKNDKSPTTIDGKEFATEQLAKDILIPYAGKSVVYLTDICFNRSNLQRLKEIADGVTLLICESNFRDEDYRKAFDKKHLTTRQAALIAASIKALHLQVFHISSIYPDQAPQSVAEAETFFQEYMRMNPEQLDAAIDKELSRATS